MHNINWKKEWKLKLFRPSARLLRGLRPAARVINAVLPAAGLVTCAAGVASLFRFGLPTGSRVRLLMWAVGIAASCALHETGHVMAAVACGCPVYDTGLWMKGPIVQGAYVNMRRVAHSRQQVQMSLAGIADYDGELSELYVEKQKEHLSHVLDNASELADVKVSAYAPIFLTGSSSGPTAACWGCSF